MNEDGAAAYEDDVPYWEKPDSLDAPTELPARNGVREAAWSDHYPPYRPATDDEGRDRFGSDVEAPLPLFVLCGLLVVASGFLALMAVGAFLGAAWAPVTDQEAAFYTRFSIASAAVLIGSLGLSRTGAWDDAGGPFATTIVLSLISAGTFHGLAGLAT